MFEHELKNAYIGEVWTPGANTVGYWKLDGNVNDSGPNSLVTTQAGTLTYGTEGSLTYGIFSSNVLTANYTLSTDWTFNVWCKPVNYNNGWCWLGSWGNSGTSSHYTFGLCGGNSGTRGTWVFTQIGYQDHYTNLMYTSVRHNVVVTKSGSTISMYVDGTNVPFTNSSTVSSQTGNVIRIGEGGAVVSERWKGYMSNFIIEDKVRTAQEISNYYNLTKANYGL